jgi:hypothetical protein
MSIQSKRARRLSLQPEPLRILVSTRRVASDHVIRRAVAGCVPSPRVLAASALPQWPSVPPWSLLHDRSAWLPVVSHFQLHAAWHSWREGTCNGDQQRIYENHISGAHKESIYPSWLPKVSFFGFMRQHGFCEGEVRIRYFERHVPPPETPKHSSPPLANILYSFEVHFYQMNSAIVETMKSLPSWLRGGIYAEFSKAVIMTTLIRLACAT